MGLVKYIYDVNDSCDCPGYKTNKLFPMTKSKKEFVHPVIFYKI
jgi:hypothetical protein